MTHRIRGRALAPAVLVALAATAAPFTSAATAAAPPAAAAARARAGARAGSKPARRAAKRTRRAAAKPVRGALLHGTTAPRRTTGAVGDFYLRTSDQTLWGPKTKGGWGRPVPLAGAPGAPGAPGATGAPGPQGAAGAPGTPALGAPAVTRLPATTISASYGEEGEAYGYSEAVATLTLPAGLSFVQVRPQLTTTGTADALFASCWAGDYDSVLFNVNASLPPVTTGSWIWTATAGETQVGCDLYAFSAAGPALGTVVSADLGGTLLAVSPVLGPAF